MAEPRQPEIEGATFPLIVLLGSNPDPQQFFSSILDTVGESAGIHRKDLLAPNWSRAKSFKAIRDNVASTWNNDSREREVVPKLLLSRAVNTWGESCLADPSRYSITKILPLQCYLLVIKRPTEAMSGAVINDKYVANYFPKKGTFDFEMEEFPSEQEYLRFQKDVDQLSHRYRVSYSSVTDDCRHFRFFVRFGNGAELGSFMSELATAMKDCGKANRGISGWETCEHGTHRYKWEWSEIGCEECRLKQRVQSSASAPANVPSPATSAPVHPTKARKWYQFWQ